MKQHDSMVEALRRRKAHPLDITISLGSPEDAQLLSLRQDLEPGLVDNDEEREEEAEELDQAPDASPVGEEGDRAPEAESNESLMDKELKKANFGRGSLANFKSKQLSKSKV